MRTLTVVMLSAVSLAGAEADLEKQIANAGDNEGEISGFVEAAAERHGLMLVFVRLWGGMGVQRLSPSQA